MHTHTQAADGAGVVESLGESERGERLNKRVKVVVLC
jgi:hypothetical protein